jgi:hypothetical protein
VQVNFLLPKAQGLPAGSERNRLHPENFLIKFTGFCDISYSQYQMINALDFHPFKENPSSVEDASGGTYQSEFELVLKDPLTRIGSRTGTKSVVTGAPRAS